jgi:hypothetical protein
MSATRVAKCTACGSAYFAKELDQCPFCGADVRHLRLALFEEIKLSGSAKLREFREGFRTFTHDWKEKIAGATGNRARESQTYDRSHPDKTVKRHVVDEEQADGTWVNVHDETVEYPAKRRPSRDDTDAIGPR